MRVNPIGAQYSKAPSFKAIIETDFSELKTFPKKDREIIRYEFEKAANNPIYKKMGSDNMKIIIGPYRGHYREFSGISITNIFLDAERAREEILANNARDYPERYGGDIMDLDNRDQKIMDRLKLEEPNATDAFKPDVFFRILPGLLDTAIKTSIDKMMYCVPREPYEHEPEPKGLLAMIAYVFFGKE